MRRVLVISLFCITGAIFATSSSRLDNKPRLQNIKNILTLCDSFSYELELVPQDTKGTHLNQFCSELIENLRKKCSTYTLMMWLKKVFTDQSEKPKHLQVITHPFIVAFLNEQPRGYSLWKALMECPDSNIDTTLKWFEKWYTLGISVHGRDADGNTILHSAVSSGEIKFVQYLVDHGCSTTATNNKAESALCVAESLCYEEAGSCYEVFMIRYSKR